MDELPLVRVAACGCVLLAAVPPIGFRFINTALGDVRQPVFACERHFHPISEAVESESSAVPPHKRRRQRKQAV